jgi:hypothetical protein
MAIDTSPPPTRRPARAANPDRRTWHRGLLAGGTVGNERLTVLTGLLLIVLLAILGGTIVFIGQLLWLHLFLGLVLLGPVALKLASTGYRFARYYTSDPAYREKGPPAPVLRGLAPLVIGSTLAVFVTGVALLVLGPGSRSPLVLLHKASFIVWIAVTALHVIGHLPEIVRLLTTARRSRREVMALRRAPARHRSGSPSVAANSGRTGRGAAISVSLLAGLATAIGLLGLFSAWTH